ncbi:MAG: hypothetical protein IPM42_14165 [Saprospiraceae bacterium]|nr:hypothetical protein [Saprospiraceae bacterium]
MNIIRVLSLLFICYSMSCGINRPHVIKSENIKDEIVISLELNQDSFLVGDEIILYFVIKNNSEHEIFVDNRPYGSMYRDGKNKVLEGFEILVENDIGKSIGQTFDFIDMRSGRFGITQIDPKQLLKIRIHDLFKYGITKKEGKYKVTISKNLDIYMDRKKGTEHALDSPENFENSLKLNIKENINVIVNQSR